MTISLSEYEKEKRDKEKVSLKQHQLAMTDLDENS